MRTLACLVTVSLVACAPQSTGVGPSTTSPGPAIEPSGGTAEAADPLAALVQEAQLIVRARVLSGRPVDLAHQHELAASRGFELFLPRYAHKRIDLEVLEVLTGDAEVGERLWFYRVDELALATEDVDAHSSRILGEEGLFLLRRSAGGFLFGADRHAFQPVDALDALRARLDLDQDPPPSAARAPAPLSLDPATLSTVELRAAMSAHGARTISLVREAMRAGDPTRRHDVIVAVEDYGVLALMPELIALVVDTTAVPADGDDIRGVVGDVAARRVARLAWMLDGVDEMQRRRHFFLRPGASRERAHEFWLRWWRTYREEGPGRSATLL